MTFAFAVLLAVLLNTLLLWAAAMATRRYRRRRAAVFAAQIVYATTDRMRDILLDFQDAISASALSEVRNKVDHLLDEQQRKGAEAAAAIAHQVENGTLAAPPAPPGAPAVTNDQAE